MDEYGERSSSLPRRQFLAGLAKSVSVVALTDVSAGLLQAQAPSPPQNVKVHAAKSVLRPEDFTYLGHYDVSLGGEFSYGQGLTHRYVGGQLRFLALGHTAAVPKYRLVEVTPPASFGNEVNAASGAWADIWATKKGGADGSWHGIWWDESGQRLWSTGAVDYPNDTEMLVTKTIAVTTLGPSGVVSNVRGLYGLEGVGSRNIFGGITRIPAWFQQQFGTGPYAVGFGGYTSRMAQGLVPSMGPALFAIPELTGFPDGTELSMGQFRVLANHTSGTVSGADWYGGTRPTVMDRGVRLAGTYTNYINNGLDYQVLNREPLPGDPVGSWNTAPDSRGRWGWCDSALQTGVWIDMPAKHGYLAIPTLLTGRVWYQRSTIQRDGMTCEFHVFDPLHLGEVVQGSRQPWDVKPASMWAPNWQSMIPAGLAGRGEAGGPSRTACAATFDNTTNRLYVRWTFASGSWPNTKDRILVWQVA